MSQAFEEMADVRPRYRLTGFGLALFSFSYLLLLFDVIVVLAGKFRLLPELDEVGRHTYWLWGVRAPIHALSLLGAYLLVGRWDTSSWRRKSVVLLILNAIEVVNWCLNHGAPLGVPPLPEAYRWSSDLLKLGMVWVGLAIYTSLVGDLLIHLGQRDALTTSRSTCAMSWTGFGLWSLLVLSCTEWTVWPLQPRFLSRAEAQLARMNFHISSLLLMIILFSVTIAGLTASRECARLVRDWTRALDREDVFETK
jgi:hypothetical protein